MCIYICVFIYTDRCWAMTLQTRSRGNRYTQYKKYPTCPTCGFSFAVYTLSEENLRACMVIPLPRPKDGLVNTLTLQQITVGHFVFYAIRKVSEQGK
jgi:hypothetical protein